jgi:hypothetical protein
LVILGRFPVHPVRESCILRYSFFVAAILCSCGKKEPHEAPNTQSSQQFTYIPSSQSGVTFKNSLSDSEYDNIIVNPHFYDGAGVAVGDINNDSLPDLYFVSNQWENKLYLNKGNFVFEDITAKAGVGGKAKWETRALMKDSNGDGLPDLYVYSSGDSSSHVFINKGDLTFTGMEQRVVLPGGSQGVDINDDGWLDHFEVGRLPYDDHVLKTTSPQRANAMRITNDDNMTSTDVAWYAGVAATDWSNEALIADFDNDGRKDIFITTGVVRRLNDLDYLKAYDSTKSVEERYSRMPPGAVPNFLFRQTGDLKFEDVSAEWIGTNPGVSTGAAYADLDNDGDLDLVVNNTNAEAFIMRNDLGKGPHAIQIDSNRRDQKDPVERMLVSLPALSFKHRENSFSPFDQQPLTPYSNARRGPKMSIGDVNGDKLPDVFICGGQGQAGTVMIQTKKGAFVAMPQPAFEADKRCEETCSALFDVDGDKDLDLLIGSGGEEFLDARLLLRLYINNGRGRFAAAHGPKRADIVNNLQKIYVNASCIAPADVDNDGDMDVFVGGGVVTGRYGFDSDSFILLNNGRGMLTGSPATFRERKHPVGMVQSAVWIDINNDKFPDLITAGEWMRPSLWMNNNGVLTEQTGTGLDSLYGCWNSLAKGDLDNDGDEDIVAGNVGLNSSFNVSKQPLKLYVTDVDNNGTFEPIMAYNDRPVAMRDQLLKQAPLLEKKFPTHASYANADIHQVVTGKILFERNVNTLASACFLNQGNGRFIRKELPKEAQMFPIFAINISDINNDGKMDILTGQAILAGRGDGTFDSLPARRSGFPGFEAHRDIQPITNVFKDRLYLVATNSDSVYVYKKDMK